MQASITYIRSSIVAGTHGGALDKLRTTQLSALKNQFARTPMHAGILADATNALALLDNTCPFIPEERDALTTAIHAKIDGADANVTDGSKTSQAHHYIFNYGHEKWWSLVTDKTKSEDERFTATVQLMHDIGLRHPVADTKKRLSQR